MAHMRAYAPEKPCAFCERTYRPRRDARASFCSKSCANRSRRSSPVTDARPVTEAYVSGMTIQQIAVSQGLPWRVVRDAVQGAGIMRRSGQPLTRGYLTTYTAAGKRDFHHRVVATEILGRPLDRTEVVHHIDGTRTNNDPMNLSVVPRRRHGLLHRQLELIAMDLVRRGLITYSEANGYTCSSELDSLSKHV